MHNLYFSGERYDVSIKKAQTTQSTIDIIQDVLPSVYQYFITFKRYFLERFVIIDIKKFDEAVFLKKNENNLNIVKLDPCFNCKPEKFIKSICLNAIEFANLFLFSICS